MGFRFNIGQANYVVCNFKTWLIIIWKFFKYLSYFFCQKFVWQYFTYMLLLQYKNSNAFNYGKLMSVWYIIFIVLLVVWVLICVHIHCLCIQVCVKVNVLHCLSVDCTRQKLHSLTNAQQEHQYTKVNKTFSSQLI